MNIIIVGCGKVGRTLARQLREEGHTITMVDLSKRRLDEAVSDMDVQGVLGNGTSCRVLEEAGIQQADLLIAVTDQDEHNMLSCLIGGKSGHCLTIARVRDPGYFADIRLIADVLGLSMYINPEWLAAQSIFHLLQFPSALDVDTFDNCKARMLRFQIESGSPLDGKNMKAVNSMLSGRMLVCIREREGDIVIPNGDTDLRVGDIISVVMPISEISSVLHRLHIRKKAVHSVTIAGGGNISEYLAMLLQRSGVSVKIIEDDLARCEELADVLPNVQIIHGDCTDQKLLQEEGLPNAEAFVCMTGVDEENILLALYANKVSHAKVITKISRIDFEDVIEDLNIGSVVYPKNLIAENIVRYVRALGNASGNNVETLYQLLDGRVEAMEFVVHPGASNIINIPLQDLRLKKGLLVCCINRGGKIMLPTGHDCIEVDDIVVIVTTRKGIRDLSDIVR